MKLPLKSPSLDLNQWLHKDKSYMRRTLFPCVDPISANYYPPLYMVCVEWVLVLMFSFRLINIMRLYKEKMLEILSQVNISLLCGPGRNWLARWPKWLGGHSVNFVLSQGAVTVSEV